MFIKGTRPAHEITHMSDYSNDAQSRMGDLTERQEGRMQRGIDIESVKGTTNKSTSRQLSIKTSKKDSESHKTFNADGEKKDEKPDLAKEQNGSIGVQNESDWLKQFIAIVVGESGNNHDEAQAIGEVIQRRMGDRGTVFSEGFVDKIGGAGQYDAIGGDIYNSIMSSSWDNILSSDNPYNERIKGAIHAFITPEDNISNGALFWNATSDKRGFNWNNYRSGVFNIRAAIGGTTYFGFTDPDRKY